jgi:hypothetical protein
VHLQDVLLRWAPRWSRRLRVWRDRRDQREIDLSRPFGLRMAAVSAATERGELYRRLAAADPPPYERLSGSVELRGSDSSLFVVVLVDEYRFAPLGPHWVFGNDITLQVRGDRIDGRPGEEWAAEVFAELCRLTSPAWGAAYTIEEFQAKSMIMTPSIEAVGRDVARFLPGLYWLNYFGPAYRDLMGRDRLLSAPAVSVEEVDDGVLLRTRARAGEWPSPDAEIIEGRVLEHLGPQYFFVKGRPWQGGPTPWSFPD